MRVSYTRSAVALVAAGGLTLGLAGTSAHADPPAPSQVTIAGVGSDTTQDVMNGLAKAYNATTRPGYIGSYDATPRGTTITTKPGCAPIARPDGSSAGITALRNDTTGCIDFARSSRSKKTDGTENTLSFFAFAKDAVTFARIPSANTPDSLTTQNLKDIYSCNKTNWKQIKTTLPSNPIHPLLPQAGSGTRAFFLSVIGLSDATVGSCVSQNIQENDGRELKGDRLALAPYSIAKYISQLNKVAPDERGGTVLGKINGIAPIVNRKINPKFPSAYQRLVYNVVEKGAPNFSALNAIFGKGGYFCSQSAIITRFGFAPIGTACGTAF